MKTHVRYRLFGSLRHQLLRQDMLHFVGAMADRHGGQVVNESADLAPFVLVDQTDVNQTALLQHVALEVRRGDHVQAVRILTGVIVRPVEEALYLGDHSAESCEKGREVLFVAISRVDGLSCVSHDKVVLANQVHFGKRFVDFDLFATGEDTILPLNELLKVGLLFFSHLFI